MPSQEEHDKPENLVEAPGEAEKAARSLNQAVDSNQTLQGYYAMNNARPSEELEKEAREDNPQDREKGHPIP
jgi:hypothetical protein